MIKSKEKVFQRKLIVTITAAILLIALYAVIFVFSAQSGEQSGQVSMSFSERAVEFLNTITGGRWSHQFIEELVLYFEHPIRKLAHFTEYACMGILVYLIWSPWMQRGRWLYLLILIWVFISGALDEFHQLFVPDRWGSFADVCLDTCGGAFGLLLCTIASKLHRGNHHKKEFCDSKQDKVGKKPE